MLLRLFWNPAEKRIALVWRLVIQLIFMLLLSLPMAILQAFMVQSRIEPTLGLMIGLNLISILLTLAAFIGSIWLAGRLFDRRKFADFGVHVSPNWWRDLGFGLLLGAVLMALIFLIEYAVGWVTITSTFHIENTQSTFWLGIFMRFLFFVSVGIYEEFIFRGYQLKNVAEGFNAFKRISPKTAILISLLLTSAVFGLAHLSNPNATWVSSFNIFLAGIFLAMGFLLTGELAIPIGLHITWNFFQGNVFGFPVSGTQAGVTLISIQQGGPALFTGGAFGPEAGLIGIAAMILGSLLTIWYVKWRYGKIALWEKLAFADFLPKHQAKLDAAAEMGLEPVEDTTPEIADPEPPEPNEA